MCHAVRRVLLSVCVVVVASALWSAVDADGHEDPRNLSPEYFEAQNRARCFSCHSDHGFDPMQVGLVERFRELPVGATQTLTLQVRHVSPMAHTIDDIAVAVDLSGAPNVVVVDENFTEDLRIRESHRLESGGLLRVPFDVTVGVERVRVVLRAVGPETLGAVGGGDGALSLMLKSETGREFEARGDRLERVFEATGEAAMEMGTGTFYIQAGWDSRVDETMEALLEVEVDYARVETEHVFRLPDVVLRTGDSAEVQIPIRVTDPGEALIEFRVESVSYFEHLASTHNPRNDGLYYRFTTMRVVGGEEVVVTAASFAPTPIAPTVELYNLFARIVGFVTLLLVPVALFTGGLMGKGSRRLMNHWLGGPKRRVLWHMAMSWAIIVLACAHFVFALLEARFAWSKGLLWGGVAWVALVSLGFTGYYQTRLIKRIGYRGWRHVHLWPAVAVLAFGVFHMAVDGSDLAALRDLLPRAGRLSWP